MAAAFMAVCFFVGGGDVSLIVDCVDGWICVWVRIRSVGEGVARRFRACWCGDLRVMVVVRLCGRWGCGRHR